LSIRRDHRIQILGIFGVRIRDPEV